MNLSHLTSFFKKRNKPLFTTESIIIKRLKALSLHSNLIFFTNTKIYHHNDIYTIPLIMLDPLRGLYIFEIKAWSYNDLKNAKIQKTQNQSSSTDALCFDKTHSIIRKKFNELTHNNGVPLFNYLVMQNLSTDEYEHLDDSLKFFLPFEKLIFSDTQESDIFKKLHNVSQENYTLASSNDILNTLFIQYTIICDDNSLELCNGEQIEFLDKKLESLTLLNGNSRSGKSSLLLLKSLVLLLENPSLRIVIIKPTLLACDIFKKKLLDIVERAIVEVDLTSIEILTPIEIVNRHLQKLSKPLLDITLEIDDLLMSKKINLADIVMCDDAFVFSQKILNYIKHIQKNSILLLVNEKKSLQKKTLIKSYLHVECQINFIKTNPHAKALHIIHNLLTQNKNEDILVIANALSKEKLLDDLEFFASQTPQSLESSEHLVKQNISLLMLATYEDINALSAKHIIMLDLCFTNPDEIDYAINLASLSVNILYEDDCQKIINLKEKYENAQE